MKPLKNILSVILAVALVLSSVVLPKAPFAYAQEDDGIVLELTPTPSGHTDSNTYKSGEPMQSQLSFKANLQDAKFRGAYLALNYSNSSYIDMAATDVYVDVKSSDVFSRIERTSDEVRLYFNEDTASDAREASFPIVSYFKLFSTPDKATSDMTLSLKLADGTVVKSTPAIHYTAEAGSAGYAYNVLRQTNGNFVYPGETTDGTTVDPAKTADVSFTYEPNYDVFSSVDRYPLTSDSNYGKRVYDHIDLYQPLPEFASFDAGKNPGWTYDAATNTAHYVLGPANYNDMHSYNPVTLKLTFPQAKLGVNYTASSKMVFHLKDKGQGEKDPTVEKTLHYRFALRAKVLNLPERKLFNPLDSDTTSTLIPEVTNTQSRIQQGAEWGFDITNSTANPIILEQVKDYKLDSRLQYKSIKITSNANWSIDGYRTTSVSGVIVRGKMNDGTTKDFGTIRTDAWSALRFGADAKDISELYLVFPDGYTLPAQSKIPVVIQTEFRDTPTVSEIASENIYANSFYMEAKGTGQDANVSYVSTPEPAKFRLVEKTIDIGFTNNLSDRLGTGFFDPTTTNPLRADGQKAIWELKTNWEDCVKGVDASEVLKNVEIVDVATEGTKITGYTYPGWGEQRPDSATIYENYNDTGLDAIVFHWNSIKAGRLNSFMDNGGILVVTEVNSNSLPGKNYNYAYVKVNGRFVTSKDKNHMGYGFGGSDSIVDERDLNENGDTTEKLAVSRASYNYAARSEILARTYIARANKDNFNLLGLKTGPETDYRYKLFNYNNKQDMTEYALVDILPHVGDYQAAKDAGAGAALERHSAFSNTLTGPVSFGNVLDQAKYTVYYSTDPIVGKVDRPAESLTWSTQVADYSQVTAIKISLNPNKVFKKGEKLEALVPMRAANNASLDSRAYNDFAISTNNADWVPTNMVYNELYEPSSELIISKKNLKGEPIEGVSFSIAAVDGGDTAKTYNVTTGNNGLAKITLPLGNYRVTETHVADEYVLDSTPKDVEIIEDETAKLEFVNAFKPISVTATKKWVGGPAEHPAIQLQLYRDGVALGDPVTLENGIDSYTWENLDKTDANGKDYVYSVDEPNVPENYVKTVDGLTLTNSYVSPKTEVVATKKWIGGPADHPEVQIQLYRDGVAFGDPVTLENGTDSHTWKNLDKTDVNGVPYVYTVDELHVPKNYSKTVEGYTICNSYESPKIDVTANKIWQDGPAEHPTIEMQLYRNGIKFGDPVTLDNGTESYTWEALDQTDANGVAYTYTVDEINEVENYSKTLDGLTITNTYVSPKTTVTAYKKWIGGPAEHPDVQLQLYRNGKALGEAVTLKSGVESYTWDNLDLTDENANEYTYTVDELTVPANYKKSQEDLVITNTYVSKTDEENGKKDEKVDTNDKTKHSRKPVVKKDVLPKTGDIPATLAVLISMSGLSLLSLYLSKRIRHK